MVFGPCNITIGTEMVLMFLVLKKGVCVCVCVCVCVYMCLCDAIFAERVNTLASVGRCKELSWILLEGVRCKTCQPNRACEV